MLTSISKTLLTGFITILPIVLTIYLLYWLAVSSESVMSSALHLIYPDLVYFPGLGVIVGLIVVFFIGLMMKAIIVRQLFVFSEQILYKLPLIKIVYRAMRDLFDFLSPKKDGLGRVVTVNINGIEMIGFITQEDTSRLPMSLKGSESVLVYLPMSYMVGGYTVFLPEDKVTVLDWSFEDAMRFASRITLRIAPLAA